MKSLLVSILSVFLLSGCAQMEEQRRECEVTPRKAGCDYAFKTWPGSTTTYTITQQGVKDVSAKLGPDFTVHYFTFEPETSLALYNGALPQGADEKATIRFRASFGSKRVTWKMAKRKSGFRAEAYVPDGEQSIWHVIVIAPTEQRIREVIGQLMSMRQRDKPAVSTTADKTLPPPGRSLAISTPTKPPRPGGGA